MLSTFSIVLPIFALILAGYMAARGGILGAAATTEINRFVVYLALPALLFDIIANTHASDVWQPGFIATFGLGSLFIFVLTIAIRKRGARSLADATIDGLNAGYANTGFIGFPLVLVAIGRDALAPTAIATIITVCAIFAAAIILIETDLQASGSRGRLFLKVGGSLLRNPLLVAPALGAIFPITGFAVPVPAETFLKLLGGAASPCALVALGLFLAQNRRPAGRTSGSAALLVGFKLVLQPLVTWLLATFVFALPPLMAQTAVLLAALPTGTGPFMLAEFYRREAQLTSSVILASTIASIATVSAYLAWAG